MVQKHRSGMTDSSPRQLFYSAYRAFRLIAHERELKKLRRSKGMIVDLESYISPEDVAKLEDVVRCARGGFELAKYPNPIIGRAKRRLIRLRWDRKAAEEKLRFERAMHELSLLSPSERDKRREKMMAEISPLK